MRRRFAFSFAAIFAATALARGDEPAIRAALSSYVEAFNSHDLSAVTATWAETAVHVDQDTGERKEGREAIAAGLATAFETRPEARLAGEIDSIRMLTPAAALVSGRSTIEYPGEEPSASLFSAALVLRDGAWQIDSITERTDPAPAPTESLSDLEWLVGTWVDDSDETRIESAFRWSDDGAFLLRTFEAQVGDETLRRGTQIIGWDPRAGQIRSWTFDADGSFGDGTWVRSGDDWTIRSSQTLSDGRHASGTFVLTRIDDDTATLRLIGHEIDGEPQPTPEAVTMRRAQEQAGSEDATAEEASETMPPEDSPAPSALEEGQGQ